MGSLSAGRKPKKSSVKRIGVAADFRRAKSSVATGKLTKSQKILRSKIREAKEKNRPAWVKKSKKRSGVIKSGLLDYKLKAMGPGYRISRNGKLYYENRKNRSDVGRT